MKLGKRSLIMMFSLITALSLSVFGTVAYLTSTARATNTFTVGNVQITLDETDVDPEGNPRYDLDADGTADVSVSPDGEITLLPDATPGVTVPEDATVDEDGNLIVGEGDPIPPSRDTGNEYHIVPGKEFLKDPTVTVKKGSEESYIRIRVEITNAEAIITALGCNAEDVFSALCNPDTANWTLNACTADTAANTITYEFRYKEPVSGAENAVVLPPLFDTFCVPGTVQSDLFPAFGEMQMNIIGEAIQTSSFADADAAWLAFEGN